MQPPISTTPRPAPLRSFASTDRFLSDIESPTSLEPGYVLLGDETFLYQRCRQGVLAALAPPETRDFSLSDFVDRFGPRLAHLNTMLAVLRPLAAAQKKAES